MEAKTQAPPSRVLDAISARHRFRLAEGLPWVLAAAGYIVFPDYLALVGDSADGFPGMPGWGKKAAGSILSVYPHFEDIPKDWKLWRPSIRNASLLAKVLFEGWEQAMLFRTLATLRTDVPVFSTVDDLRWSPRCSTHFYELQA